MLWELESRVQNSNRLGLRGLGFRTYAALHTYVHTYVHTYLRTDRQTYIELRGVGFRATRRHVRCSTT